ncbi:glycoside hydrolase family 97 protein [Bacteroides sp.]|uniref:glycoside hydrolase family 97 protein n=1 Tax=Bacteroides sp. TaxID=29523 RepID=UPI0025C6D88D|nr:glycoside hydrolase family 97 protein [Bacteroides sp.]
MKLKILLLLCVFLSPTISWGQKALRLQSLDLYTELLVTLDKELKISITHHGTEVLQPSAIGMNIRSIGMIGENPKLQSVSKRSVAEQIKTPIYKKEKIDDVYNELTVRFKGNYSVIFRCYNQGVTYRFVTDFKEKEIVITNEKATFHFPSDTKGYAAYSNYGDDNDLSSQYFNSFENTYDHQSLTDLNNKRLIFFPFLAELPDGGRKVCITESDLQDYPGMFLMSNPEDFSMKGVWAPLPQETEQGGHNLLQQIVTKRYDYIARTAGKRAFPWRILAITENDGELLDNDLVYLTAAPSLLKDVSWIKPGKVAWDWWNDWNISGVDFRAGVNNDTYKHYIDFASKNQIEYVILDEGWAVDKQADMLQVIPEINLEELVAYGKAKNVDIILWAGYWAFHKDMAKVVKHYADMGVKGFKVDFLDRDDQNMIRFMWEAAELCSRHHMILNYHGACKPFGIQRTYPNVMNFEGVHGLEQMKWRPAECDQVTYDLQFPFIRMLAGPVDYTQGAMRNATRGSYYPVYSNPISQGTRCRQLAEYVVLDSPFNMLCDSPTQYMKEQECTNFISSVPTVWDETRPLNCRISQYIHIARRKGDIWYVGGMNDWSVRETLIDLSFLSHTNYNVEIFCDGMNADRNASDYRREIKKLPADKKLKIKMHPGGGYIIKIIPCTI